MKFGFKKYDLEVIIAEIIKFPEIEEALIYGSRAMGNYEHGSDVDIAIKGKFVNDYVIRTLLDKLENDTNLPYFFDLSHYENMNNPQLQEHINKEGKTIYEKQH